jgi:hypothetical protein
MLTHFAHWQRFHAPLMALAVALALALAARFLRVGLLAAAAGGVAVCAGWFVLIGRLWALPPAPLVDQLGAFAAVALLTGLLSVWLGPGRLAWFGVLLVAVVGAWLFAGAPRELAGLRANWPVSLGIAVALAVFARVLAPGAFDPLRPALAALTLAAALHVAGVPPLWTQAALVAGIAALSMFALPPVAGAAALPVAADIGALGCVAVLSVGRLPRLGFAPADAAALSPLLAAWLQPRAATRFAKLGQAASWAGAMLAGAIAVGCVWLFRQAVGH